MGGILQICYLLFAVYCSFSDCYIPHRKISSALANSSAPACLPHRNLSSKPFANLTFVPVFQTVCKMIRRMFVVRKGDLLPFEMFS